MLKERSNQEPDWQSILNIWEGFSETTSIAYPGGLKRRAAAYLGDRDPHKPLNKTELRQLLVKANKMKNSTKKEERARGIELEKQVQRAFNFHR